MVTGPWSNEWENSTAGKDLVQEVYDRLERFDETYDSLLDIPRAIRTDYTNAVEKAEQVVSDSAEYGSHPLYPQVEERLEEMSWK